MKTKFKAISLWQPWASAIALGLKTIETRSWPSGHRGPIAIHAAKRWTRAEREFLEGLKSQFDAAEQLTDPLPLGAVVAVAELVACEPTHKVGSLSELEMTLGNYLDGRWAWQLKNVRALKTPLPWRGAQGFFDVWIPDELLSPA